MIICCGEALIDMVRVQIPGSGEGFLPLPGGSPYNTAIAIGRLGAEVMFLGKYSKDFFGEMLLKRLKENHVNDDLIIRSEQNSSLAFVNLEEGKEPEYVFYTEGTADRSLCIGDLPERIPVEAGCICFGSISMIMEPAASTIETLILRENARKGVEKEGPVISFDPNIRPFMIKDKEAFINRTEKLIAVSTIVKISNADLGYIYPGMDIDKAIERILSIGPRLIIATLGPDGALALLRHNDGNIIKVIVPAVDIPLADTIGAGDTFHGAFLSWLEIKGMMSRFALANMSSAELYEALLFANKAAAIVCSRRGAEPPTLKEVEELKMK
ncbi:MAG: carbohydrate kinase [Treponema sp.]|jgi:fructokinase|nr:carbohydrate kinase [Treponema sp.]